MRFAIPILIFGLYLLLVPLIIHLINMMRHRRVQWAAMDFLLASYKKHRNYVWLKQLLLLLARISAVLLLVALVAHFQGCDGDLIAKFGGTVTHHYVLIDDSYSMSDSSGARHTGSSEPDRAIDRAKKVITEIANIALGSDTPQKFTVIRFSRAAQVGSDVPSDALPAVADINAMTVGSGLLETVEEARNNIHATQLSTGPGPALDVVRQLITGAKGEQSRVYLVSDFRSGQWSNPTDLQKKLEYFQEEESDTGLHFVHCVEEARSNLAITRIEPDQGSLAAGVPLFVHVTVKNFGDEVARDVVVGIETIEYVDRAIPEPEQEKGASQELPSIDFKNIQPGQSSTGRVQVFFPSSGQHVVRATLPPDIIEADNSRWCIVELPDSVPILLIDGSESGIHHTHFLDDIFNSESERALTGVNTVVEPVSLLRDSTPEELYKYHAIYLLDVERLEARALSNLEEYVEQGGGLCIYMGEECDFDFYNQMHGEGEGLFPAALPRGLERVAGLPRQTDEQVPDLEITNHPLFKIFQGERNTYLRSVMIGQYVRTAPDWEPDPERGTSILARVRGSRKPLIVERRYGEGIVIAFLTTLAPDWNNWAKDPSFVVLQLELQKYLTSSRRGTVFRQVGSPVSLQFDATEHESKAIFFPPSGDLEQSLASDVFATPPSSDSSVLSLTLGDPRQQPIEGAVDQSGIYEVWSQNLLPESDEPAQVTDGLYEVTRFALNVDSTEGNTILLTSDALSEKLSSIQFQSHEAGSIGGIAANQSGNWAMLLLMALIGLLLAEQLLAYLTSYHPIKGAVA